MDNHLFNGQIHYKLLKLPLVHLKRCHHVPALLQKPSEKPPEDQALGPS